MAAIPDFPVFDVTDLPSAGPRWKKYVSRFENLTVAIGLKNTDQARKAALFLHYMGPECGDIYETLKVVGDNYDAIKAKLDGYFVPKYNVDFERHMFRTLHQAEDENLDEFCTRLRRCAVTCEFEATHLDNELKLQLQSGCKSSRLRAKGVKPGVDLAKFLEIGKEMDLIKSRSERMEGSVSSAVASASGESVNTVRRSSSHYRGRGRSRGNGNSRGRSSYGKRSGEDRRDASRKCFSCGGLFPHDGDCPAKSRKCHECKSYGHYAKFCGKARAGYTSGKSTRGRPTGRPVYNVRQSENVDSDSSEYSLAVHASPGMEKIPTVSVMVNGVKCDFLMDSGTTVNTVDNPTYTRLCDGVKDLSVMGLSPPEINLYPYGSRQPLPVRGKFEATVKSGRTGQVCAAPLYVMETATGNLLSYDTASKLKIIQLVNYVGDCDNNNIDACVNSIIADYEPVFHGLGKLKDYQLKLNIDDSVPNICQKHRYVPFASRPKLEKALAQLYDDDICEDLVNTPTPWVSPVVIVPKPKDPDNVRICIDMRAANRAIKRVKHPMPTVHELIHDLNGCKVFTKLDLRQGYHQIELHPDSRYITTFSTHLGLHRYKRLNFGVNAASEKFQQIIEQVLEGLEGVRNLSDDIIIASANNKLHEKHVRACLQRLMDRGLTANKSKCEFFKKSIEFFGSVFGEDGISPDPKKVRAVREAPKPTDKRGVKSILGMGNYVQRYIPGFASMVKPLRDLTKADTEFVWDSHCDEAWAQLKESLTSDTVMSYFDSGLETELVVDAAPCGLGAILTQIHYSRNGDKEVKVVSYASRALDDVESRYSQTEREALAVRWGVEHYHLYLYDKPFTVITDHKPLVSVFRNPLAKPSARIERWCLRLQQYSFSVVYRPGANNPADFMSRHPVKSQCDRDRKVAEDYINYVCAASVPKAVSVQEVATATAGDPVLVKVMRCMRDGRWYKHIGLVHYEKLRGELSVTEGGVLLRGNRIVVPHVLQRTLVDAAHEGHQGIVKTKALLRTKVWFPSMDVLVDRVVSNCSACATVSKDERIRPLHMSELPDRKWQCLSADFGGPYPSGHYCLVIIDEYSRFPVVEIIKSTSAKTVIPVLDKVFSTFGIPEVIKTDNGPPFQSHEMRAFMKQYGIKHRKITPLWPRANAQAEGFMKPLNKAIKAANVEGKSWRQEMHKFLRNYRATPHVTTGKAPAELLFGDNIRVLLPEIFQRKDDGEVRDRDARHKQRQKFNADRRNCYRPVSKLKVGDHVLVRQTEKNKLTPPYMPEPLKVITVNGTMVTATDPDHGKGTKTRNISQFKAIPEPDCNSGNEVSAPDVASQSNVPMVVPSSPDPRRTSSRTKATPTRYKDFVMK